MSPPAALHGSAEHYKARLAEVSAQNDALRVELDAAKERIRELEAQMSFVQASTSARRIEQALRDRKNALRG